MTIPDTYRNEGIIPVESKLEAVKHTRQIAADSLFVALTELQDIPTFSESQLADAWLANMRRYPAIFPDGWYTPPPHGVGVLIGSEGEKSRHNYKSLRLAEMWPKKDIHLSRINTLTYVYASPVHRRTCMIGDFGVTLYFGTNPAIKDHLRHCLDINRKIFEFVQVGMQFQEVYNYARKVFEREHVTNQVTSQTDSSGVNIGHTVPVSYEDWTTEEWYLLQGAETGWEQIKDRISVKRAFINSSETEIFRPGMAFTLEPRLTVVGNLTIPMSSFHTIILFRSDGSKELLTNFDNVFQLVNMQYLHE